MTNNLRSLIKSIDLPQSYESYQDLVQGTNINVKTLLATDYLNHFNEIIMLVDMISDMPECIDDIAAWTPKSYQEHFQESGFSDKDLAVAAYEYVPKIYRTSFEHIVSQLNKLVLQVALRLTEAAAVDDHKDIAAVALFGPELRMLVEKAGAVINGESEGTDQADIDAMLRE